MQIKALIEDEDAVSPVIGVILMVAITVILAAVIGTFVLGLGDQVQSTSPNTSFTFAFTENGGGTTCTTQDLSDGSGPATGELKITHNGGGSIDLTQAGLDIVDTNDGVRDAWSNCGGDTTTDTKVQAGHAANPNVDSDDEVDVVWTKQGSGKSATLGSWSGPDS